MFGWLSLRLLYSSLEITNQFKKMDLISNGRRCMYGNKRLQGKKIFYKRMRIVNGLEFDDQNTHSSDRIHQNLRTFKGRKVCFWEPILDLHQRLSEKTSMMTGQLFSWLSPLFHHFYTIKVKWRPRLNNYHFQCALGNIRSHCKP